ncbi:YslB family protein [Bacillus thermotolerans]|uniref:YslB family protein n=1 Tax=Bacillus thermotolerans TaxID=1221996 RepID=UPI0028F3F327|nr:YslB family protein [Bacillus thermotolerans]
MTNQLEHQTKEEKSLMVPIFGYELIRDTLLTDILGKETSFILYWAGKSLARKFPCSTDEDLCSFFEEAGWGALRLLKEDKREKVFELTGPLIKRRLSIKENSAFTLESGFLAEQLTTQSHKEAEAVVETAKRAEDTVTITVKWT